MKHMANGYLLHTKIAELKIPLALNIQLMK